MKLKIRQLICILCFLIVFQVFWLDFRLDKLIKNSPENLAKQKQKQTEEELRKVPEVKIEEKLAKGAELWLESLIASSSGDFKLKILAKSDRPIKKADLRLFYPPDILQVNDPNWQVKAGGLAFWSGKIKGFPDRLEYSDPGSEFLVKTISFKPLKQAKAKIEFDFSKESLLDCNLFDEKGNDRLEKAVGRENTITNF